MDEYNLIKKKQDDEEKRKKKGLLFVLGDRIKHGRLLFLLVAFILTLIGLSTSTYAWFTSNYTVSVQEIDVNVSSGSGIQISTNAETWKSMITISDIKEHAYSNAVNQVPTSENEVNPVSTVKALYEAATTKSSGLHMFKGTIVSDETDGTNYLNSASETDGSNNDYVAFDLFLKIDFKGAATKQVYLTSNTGITGGTTDTDIEYAGRMGFVVQGYAETTDSISTITNLKAASTDNPAKPIVIYEPNYDVHTANGLVNGRDVYGITRQASGNAQPATMYGVKAAFEYNPQVSGSGTALNSTDSNKFDLVTPDIATTAGNASNTSFLSLPVGITKMRVYMWVEGQDIDCENTASGGQIKFNLGFTLEAPSSPTVTATP